MGGGGKKPLNILKPNTPFVHNPHSKKTEKILAMPNEGLCNTCHDTIEWRKKFRKYKPLTAPAKCSKCLKRNVVRAYHELCEGCATALKVCAKCHKSKEIVAEMTSMAPGVKDKELDQYNKAIKKMSESERRTFYRVLEKEETPKKKGKEGTKDEDDDEEEEEEEEEEKKKESVSKLTTKTAQLSIFNNDKVKIAMDKNKTQKKDNQDSEDDDDDEYLDGYEGYDDDEDDDEEDYDEDDEGVEMYKQLKSQYKQSNSPAPKQSTAPAKSNSNTSKPTPSSPAPVPTTKKELIVENELKMRKVLKEEAKEIEEEEEDEDAIYDSEDDDEDDEDYDDEHGEDDDDYDDDDEEDEDDN